MSTTRMTRRSFLGAASATAAAAVLAACQPTPTPAPPTKPPATAVPAATAAPTRPAATAVPAATSVPADPWAIYPPEDPRHWLLNKKVEPLKKYNNLVITQNYEAAPTYKEGEKVDDNVKTRWVQAQMGLTFKAVWSGRRPADYWPTALASGDLAEFLTNINPDVLVQLLDADKLADITDIWEKTASPLTKKKKLYPDAIWWRVLTKKGRIYGIPKTAAAGYQTGSIFWVRQDWLDKVKLPFPQTLDQVYETGKAFVKEGLSKFGLYVTNLLPGVDTLEFVFGAYGSIPRIWKRGSDGKLAYTSLNPLQKEALAVAAKWYKDGILDPEYLTQADANKYVGGNLAGMSPGAWWWSVNAIAVSMMNDAKAKWAFGQVPAGPGGKRGRLALPGVDTQTGFRKGIDPLKIEAVINQLNWFYEIEDNNQTAVTGNILVFKDYDYVMEGDTAKSGQFSTNRYNPGGMDFNTTRHPGLDLAGYGRGAAQNKMDPKTLNPLQRLWSADPNILLGNEALLGAIAGAKHEVITDYLWPVPSSVAPLVASLTKLEDDAYAKIITGKAPVSAWDQFAQDWVKQGGDKVTAAINDEDAKRK